MGRSQMEGCGEGRGEGCWLNFDKGAGYGVGWLVYV